MVPIPLDRWWRLVMPPVPQHLHTQPDPAGGARLFVDGIECGHVQRHDLGRWLEAVVTEQPRIVAALERVALDRALLLHALHDHDPTVAVRYADQLGLRLDGSDVRYGVGDAAETALRHHSFDDPPEPLG